MTFQQFLTKWNGKYCEVAGSSNAQNQCVDLANAYIRDVLGLPIIEWTNAIDFPSKAGANYDYILNTPDGVPKEGDLVIWGGTTAGHIAVFVEGDANTFRSFDQNYPVGSPCHVQGHTYANVLGWLHCKVANSQNLEEELTKVREERDRNWNYFVAVCDALGVGANKDLAVEEAKKLVALEDKYNEKDKQLQDANVKIEDLTTKLATVSFDHTELIADHQVLESKASELTIKVTEYEKRIEDQGHEISTLSTSLQNLKNDFSINPNDGWAWIGHGLKILLRR